MGMIKVANLGKAYKQYPSRWMRLIEWIMPGKVEYHELKWVLQDISFTVQSGEAVGIIGINGAGKSTLLKLITGTTQPTIGSVQLDGRVAAMLELGMGFDPDFTGRQNAYMAGQLLGMTSADIEHLMPNIEAFAEIGEYIDQPVRVYSSGMQMRLAFSVATAIRPDVLIVDEALSVGDSYFQHKSFERIREFRKLGTTLLIVSHDKQAIQSICDRAILLSKGNVVMEGDPEVVMDYYNALLADHQNQEIKQEFREDGKIQTISGTKEVSIVDVSLIDENNHRVEVVAVGQSISLSVVVICNEPVEELVIGYMIKDRLGQSIFGTNTYYHQCKLHELTINKQIKFNFNFSANIGPGSYSIAIALHADDTHLSKNYEWRDHAVIFEVINIDKIEFVGVAWIPPTIRVLE
ncbi:ABC transporter ATP-binding protein [Acinetobacter faecalis]|uniref:ABC transporter ATP-binding protein n=1 Tax=Acinetobacter faecalis TaxID=2665161 RepID=UPI002A90A303|nr:ABC transporter ATP-binding protein [Acinetobacter faecalis]MDY6523621.1 ABC transporter ATP-binding protein [Acinetobacter faecalis]